MARPTEKSLAFTVVEKVEQMSRSTFDVVDDVRPVYDSSRTRRSPQTRLETLPTSRLKYLLLVPQTRRQNIPAVSEMSRFVGRL